MERSSFRDILAQFLEEETPSAQANETPAKRFAPEPPPLLNWQNPTPHTAGKAYPRPAKAAAQPQPKPQEVLVPLNCLLSEDRLRVVVLQNMGAHELESGLSSARLKKAYRRLAKDCHPDRNQGREAQFRLLQDAYEGLNRALKKLSASVDDSESASAAGSPRRAAA